MLLSQGTVHAETHPEGGSGEMPRASTCPVNLLSDDDGDAAACDSVCSCGIEPAGVRLFTVLLPPPSLCVREFFFLNKTSSGKRGKQGGRRCRDT